MKNLYKQKRQQGFTIIEVLIVLAIAALILLIVFLAVPALQRNSRNTGRNSDASRMAAGINNYIANSNGKLPTDVTLPSIITDVGNLGQFGTLTAAGTSTSNCNGTAGTVTGLKDTNLTICTYSAAVTFGPLTNAQDGMALALKATCDYTSPGLIGAGNRRQAALLYSIESGSTNGTVKCINI